MEVLDFMAASLKKELDEYSEEEIKELTASAYSVLKMHVNCPCFMLFYLMEGK